MSLRAIILAVVALAFVGLIATVYKYRGDAIGARAEAARINAVLQKAVDANHEQQRTIAEMRRQATIDADLVASLQDELSAANQSTLSLATKLSELKSGNPDVKSFLDLPVPEPLKRMYDRP